MSFDRRRFLKRTGGLATVTVLAGCTSDGGGSEDETTEETTESEGSDDTTAESEDTTTTTSEGGDSEGVTLGVPLPFSGDYAWVGSNVLPVMEMIVEEINDEGGIGGEDVSLVQADTEASPDAAVSAVDRLINVENVQAVVGPTSITMSAVVDTLMENEIPVVTPTAGTTSLDDTGGEYIFRTVSSDSLGGRAIAVAAADEEFNTIQNYEEMALMVGNEEVFQSFKDPVRSAFEELGGTITTAMDVRTGKASYSSEVQQMMDSDPDITVLIASVEDSVKITEAGYQAGYEGNWFLTQDQTNEDFLSQSENQVTTDMLGLQAAPYGPAEEEGRLDDFFDRIEEYADWDDGEKQFVTNTHDAMNVLGLALKQVEVDGDDLTGSNIAAAIPEIATPPEETVTNYTDGAQAIEDGTDVDYGGLVGPIDFDDNGDIVAPFYIQKVEDGSWTEASYLPPEEL